MKLKQSRPLIVNRPDPHRSASTDTPPPPPTCSATAGLVVLSELKVCSGHSQGQSPQWPHPPEQNPSSSVACKALLALPLALRSLISSTAPAHYTTVFWMFLCFPHTPTPYCMLFPWADTLTYPISGSSLLNLQAPEQMLYPRRNTFLHSPISGLSPAALDYSLLWIFLSALVTL